MPALLLLLSGRLHRVHLRMELRQPDALRALQTIILSLIQARIDSLIRIGYRGIHAAIARLDVEEALLFHAERIETQMERRNLSGDVLLSHGLPSSVAVSLLGLPRALLLLMRREPLPLRLPLGLPGHVRLAWTVIRLGPEVAVWVARATHESIAQLPFGDIDVLPALRPQAFVTRTRAIEPRQQVSSSSPEGPQELEAGKSVHTYTSS
jgi:hypothetical protein